MKTLVIIVPIIKLTCIGIAQAQGTLVLSNLGQTPITNMVAGSDSWLAVSFETGTNSGGYSLNSLQLLMGAASGNPSSFAVSLYNMTNTAAGGPQSSLGILNGSANPLTPGIYTYSASGLTLSPSTLYAVVVTATTPIATGAYDWNATGPVLGSLQPWYFIYSYGSSDGSSWGLSRSYYFQLAIYVTPVPEPGTGALICLGLAGLGWWRRKRRDVHL